MPQINYTFCIFKIFRWAPMLVEKLLNGKTEKQMRPNVKFGIYAAVSD